MKIRNILQKEPVIATAEDSVMECAQLMREHHVGDVIVVEETDDGTRRPIGIATDRDIVVSLVAEGGEGFRKTSIKSVMSGPLIVAELEDDIDEVVQNMKTNGIRRVPVVDTQNNIAGLVSFDDLVGHYSDRFAELEALVQQEIQHESERDRG
jgi:CBS domain-containing protein